MAWLKACLKMLLVTSGIVFGGFALCGGTAFVVISLFGSENLITRVFLYSLVVPLLISFLLGVGLGSHTFHSTCEHSHRRDDDR